MTESLQQSMFEAAPLRAPAATVGGGADLLTDHVRLARLRSEAPTKRHFCIQAGLEPTPISFARVNAALMAAGLPPYASARRAA